MIGYGKLGLLIECMKKLLLVLVLFGSLGSNAFDRLLSVADSWLLYFLAYKACILS